MSDAPDDTPIAPPAPTPDTAGSLLRQARMAKGLHIAALAASIKVAPRKLELLEADRHDELPGATFTRALAQTVCRTLKIDAAPVLALLPQPAGPGLSQLSRGLNEPFRDKPGRRVPSDLSFLRSPIVLAAALLVLASAVVYLLPAGWVAELTQQAGAGTTAGGGDTAPVAATSSPSTTVITLPPPSEAMAASDAMPGALPASSASAPSAPASLPTASASPVVAPTGALLLRAQERSWVEVIDGRGNPLISRMLEAGEAIGLDGPTPLRVKIGNAAATQVSFRGRAVDLVPSRDNVAKLELR